MKKRQVVIGIVIMLLIMCTTVYATVSGDIGLSISPVSILEAGDEFSVTLSLKDLNLTKGLKSVEGYINIDKNIIENLTIDSIVTSNGKVTINTDNILTVYDTIDSSVVANSDAGIFLNTNPISGRGDYRLVINFNKEITTDVDLITINFKVKSDVSNGTYENAIEFSTFRIFTDTEKGIILDKAIGITVGTLEPDIPVEPPIDPVNPTDPVTPVEPVDPTVPDEPDEPDTPVNPSDSDDKNQSGDDQKKDDNDNNNNNSNATLNGSNNSGNNNSGNNNSGTTQKDDTVSKSSLPNAGYKFVILPIIVAVIAGIVFYKKYKKIENYK